MTISAARRSSKGGGGGHAAGGFSLLEMVIALSLVALVVSIGAISYASGRDQRSLREAAVRIEEDEATTGGWRETPWILTAPITVQVSLASMASTSVDQASTNAGR